VEWKKEEITRSELLPKEIIAKKRFKGIRGMRKRGVSSKRKLVIEN